MPRDLEMAMCSGWDWVTSGIHSLDIPHARDAADRGYHALELPLVFDLHRHIDDRSVVAPAVVGASLQAPDIGLLIEQHRRELVQHAGLVLGVDLHLNREGLRV